MKRRIITTKDGSKTIQIECWNEQYHSTHGAIQESEHVFIKMGLAFICSQLELDTIEILEMGFGTGLNALLSCVYAHQHDNRINYQGVEAFPISSEELEALNYTELISEFNTSEVFQLMHTCSWNFAQEIDTRFHLLKKQCDFSEIMSENAFHLIYFDAFGARVQPELWTETMFLNMYKALKSNGVLVTYSAKGSVRRAMQAVGFKVERLPGPPGKREMLRATKLD